MTEAAEWNSALTVVMMPRDANPQGCIFGGVILSLIDQSGFIEARRHGTHRYVTVSIDRVDFHAAVHMGDVVRLETRVHRTGKSSIAMDVRVLAERYTTGDIVEVTTARMTMVAVNAAGKPIPINSAPTVGIHPLGGAS